MVGFFTCGCVSTKRWWVMSHGCAMRLFAFISWIAAAAAKPSLSRLHRPLDRSLYSTSSFPPPPSCSPVSPSIFPLASHLNLPTSPQHTHHHHHPNTPTQCPYPNHPITPTQPIPPKTQLQKTNNKRKKKKTNALDNNHI